MAQPHELAGSRDVLLHTPSVLLAWSCGCETAALKLQLCSQTLWVQVFSLIKQEPHLISLLCYSLILALIKHVWLLLVWNEKPAKTGQACVTVKAILWSHPVTAGFMAMFKVSLVLLSTAKLLPGLVILHWVFLLCAVLQICRVYKLKQNNISKIYRNSEGKCIKKYLHGDMYGQARHLYI